MNLFDKDAASIDVANRLRELREQRNFSIRTLAQKSGLSANALSSIERRKSSPSVSTLYKIADALGVPITSFFSPPPERNRVVLVRSGERTRMPFPRGVWEGLGGEQFIGRVEPFLLTLETGASSGLHNMVHSGHEFVFCLRGQLEYHVENQNYLLEPGDALLFSAFQRHRWRNPGNTVTNVLIVLSDFAEGENPKDIHLMMKL